jgi:hypothetical protein
MPIALVMCSELFVDRLLLCLACHVTIKSEFKSASIKTANHPSLSAL